MGLKTGSCLGGPGESYDYYRTNEKPQSTPAGKAKKGAKAQQAKKAKTKTASQPKEEPAKKPTSNAKPFNPYDAYGADYDPSEPFRSVNKGGNI